jgi:hypothetical protein
LLVLVALTIAVGGVQGCGVVPLPCSISVAALGPDPSVSPGEPMPDDLVVIAGPGDLDPDATTVTVDGAERSTISVRLVGDAVARLAAHSEGHAGEYLAIAIDDTVVSVPMIMASIPNGELQVTLVDADVPVVSQQLAGCIH